MLKKINNQPKAGNIAKIKYFLPSSNQNRYEASEHSQNKLTNIKRSLNNKYKASYSNSKQNSKRHSTTKIQHPKATLSSQINLNDDVSFEIVGIRDAQDKHHQISKPAPSRNYKYPLGESSLHLDNFLKHSSKQTKTGITFGSSKDKNKIIQVSKAISSISRVNQFEKIAKSFPKPEEKQQFEKFLQTLKKDENYQNTITMFTIMYFYEQKDKKK